ncbi:peroxynitrite isomerase THAP4-like isoform X2 [Haliotis asinina]|uniref:peroxynitrite isomerase THAP4-like isoform X2 n=1 Tax=Haliotis asinina TaxID=109174 RepID=UPI0035327D7A
MAVQGAALHDMVKPLEWLLGKWRSEEGQGKYPTLKDFKYGEEVEFSHVGQPNLQFSAYSWHLENKMPLHREVGFVRIKPGTNQVAFVVAQNIGLSEIEEGEVTGQSLKTTSHTVGRLTFGKPPQTQQIMREFQRSGDILEQVVSMKTENTDMTEHLRIKYKKI